MFPAGLGGVFLSDLLCGAGASRLREALVVERDVERESEVYSLDLESLFD